jgi:hypothetical protein
MLITPQALASIADVIGLFRAYAIVAVLLICALVVFFFARAIAKKSAL